MPYNDTTGKEVLQDELQDIGKKGEVIVSDDRFDAIIVGAGLAGVPPH